MSGRIYEDYDEAAGNSRSRKAITRRSWTVDLAEGVRQLKIVKPLFQSPYAVYASAPSIKARWNFSYSLVDQCTEWESF